MSAERVVLDLRHAPERKFTRGEHCIYVNLVVTFALLFIIVGVYLVHLYYVKHDMAEALRFSSLPAKIVLREESPEYWPVSIVSLDSSGGEGKLGHRRALCKGILLRSTWTVAPGHCVLLSKNVELKTLRYTWRITYTKSTVGFEETAVKRSMTYPGFSLEDLRHNLGLLEHSTPVLEDSNIQHPFSHYRPITDLMLKQYQDEIYMVSMTSLNTSSDWKKTMQKNLASVIARGNCEELSTPMTELRSYEFCLGFPTPRSDQVSPGEAVVMHGYIVGMVSWGDGGAQGVPFVVLNLLYYHEWMRDASAAPDDPDYAATVTDL